MKKRKKNGQTVRRKPKPTQPARREPNELELLGARFFARILDVGDATLQVFERDPERAVNAVLGVMEGAAKAVDFAKKNPDQAKRIAAGLAVAGVNKVSHAVISASARQLRKDLNGKRTK